MTNMYDVAYELQKGIAQSQEFMMLKQSYDTVMADGQARELFDQFRRLQMELQQKMMSGEAISPEDNVKSQQILGQVQQNQKIAALMEIEQRMNLLITDLNKIIMKPLEEIYKM